MLFGKQIKTLETELAQARADLSAVTQARDSAIDERDFTVAERDSAIRERDTAISERDEAIGTNATLTARVAELEAQVVSAQSQAEQNADPSFQALEIVAGLGVTPVAVDAPPGTGEASTKEEHWTEYRRLKAESSIKASEYFRTHRKAMAG